MDYMNDLHEMCETIARALNAANEKIRNAGGKLSAADVDYVDKLTHALKSIKSTIAMMEESEAEEYSNYSRDGGSYRGYSRGSYARGRMNAKRDSMGRYSGEYSREYRDGYSRGGSMADQLRDMMQDAPDDRTRQEFQRMIEKLEQR